MWRGLPAGVGVVSERLARIDGSGEYMGRRLSPAPQPDSAGGAGGAAAGLGARGSQASWSSSTALDRASPGSTTSAPARSRSTKRTSRSGATSHDTRRWAALARRAARGVARVLLAAGAREVILPEGTRIHDEKELSRIDQIDLGPGSRDLSGAAPCGDVPHGQRSRHQRGRLQSSGARRQEPVRVRSERLPRRRCRSIRRRRSWPELRGCRAPARQLAVLISGPRATLAGHRLASRALSLLVTATAHAGRGEEEAARAALDEGLAASDVGRRHARGGGAAALRARRLPGDAIDELERAAGRPASTPLARAPSRSPSTSRFTHETVRPVERLLADDPGRADVRRSLARVLAGESTEAAALRHLETLLARGEETALLLEAAALAVRAGQPEVARRHSAARARAGAARRRAGPGRGAPVRGRRRLRRRRGAPAVGAAERGRRADLARPRLWRGDHAGGNSPLCAPRSIRARARGFACRVGRRCSPATTRARSRRSTPRWRATAAMTGRCYGGPRPGCAVGRRPRRWPTSPPRRRWRRGGAGSPICWAPVSGYSRHPPVQEKPALTNRAFVLAIYYHLRAAVRVLVPGADAIFDGGSEAEMVAALEAALLRPGGATAGFSPPGSTATACLKVAAEASASRRATAWSFFAPRRRRSAWPLSTAAVARRAARDAGLPCATAASCSSGSATTPKRAAASRARWPSTATPAGLLRLAACDPMEGEPRRALDRLGDSVGRPRSEGPAIHVYRGEAHRRLGDHAAALADLTRACELHPTRVGAWVNLGLSTRRAATSRRSPLRSTRSGSARRPCSPTLRASWAIVAGRATRCRPACTARGASRR